MKVRYAPFCGLLLVLLSACATFGYEQPRSLPDRIAYVTSGADAVVVSTTNALNAHVISSTDAQFVSTTGKQLSLLVQAASTDPDPKSAEGRLALAESVLRQLQSYLASKQVKS
jgi:hypothetical protein